MAYSVAVSDGEMTDGERRMLEDMRSEMNLEMESVSPYQAIAELDILFDTRQSRVIALTSLIRLGFADRAYEIEEQCYIDDVRKAFGYSDKEFTQITDWVKRLVSLENEMDVFLA